MEHEGNMISDILKEIPLETRVKVSIEAYFIKEYGGCFLLPLDKNGEPIPEAVEANRICFEKSKELVSWVLEDIKKWKDEGCPEYKHKNINNENNN